MTPSPEQSETQLRHDLLKTLFVINQILCWHKNSEVNCGANQDLFEKDSMGWCKFRDSMLNKYGIKPFAEDGANNE